MTDQQPTFQPCPVSSRYGHEGDGAHSYRHGEGFIYCTKCGHAVIATGTDRRREYRPAEPVRPPLETIDGSPRR